MVVFAFGKHYFMFVLVLPSTWLFALLLLSLGCLFTVNVLRLFHTVAQWQSA